MPQLDEIYTPKPEFDLERSINWLEAQITCQPDWGREKAAEIAHRLLGAMLVKQQ